MDKSLELKLFEYIYGLPTDWNVISTESPDFICIKSGSPVLGVEITELFTNETDARLDKIDGYSLALLNGGDFRHKEDKENIKVDRVKYIKKGNDDGPEIDAIIHELPNFSQRANLLIKTIIEKEGKAEKYLESCSKVDLIINDASRLFWFEKYENIFFPLSRLIDRQVIIDSKFREIFLITACKKNSIIKIPLKLNLFAEDINILEKLIVDSKSKKKIGDPKKAIILLLHCLYKSGYKNITVKTEDGCIGLIVGSHLYLYAKNGKEIRDYSTIPEQLSTGEFIDESASDLSASEKKIAFKILKDRKNYKCCMSLFIEVGNV